MGFMVLVLVLFRLVLLFVVFVCCLVGGLFNGLMV